MADVKFLPALAKHGLKAFIKPGGMLWLEPKANITPRVREVVRENKQAILTELWAARGGPLNGRMLYIPCSECWHYTMLAPCLELQYEQSLDSGCWYCFACKCGNEGYICERDFMRWYMRRTGHKIAA